MTNADYNEEAAVESAEILEKPLLAGRRVSGVRRLEIISPWTGEACAEVEEISPAQAEEAAAAAAASAPAMRALNARQRADAARFVSGELARRAELFARLICEDVGKPLGLARGEVARAVGVFRLAAEEALRPEGGAVFPDREPPGEGCVGRLRRFPRGPVLAVGPFNFPLNLLVHKIAPAVAAGCPVVVKPPPQGPRAALLLGEILLRAGLPENAVQILPADLDAAAVLTASPHFAVLSFTGSAAVGWKLKHNAPARQRVLLELGGNAALVVDESADLDAAARAAALGAYLYAGQVCISTQRLFVHRAVAERFLPLLEEKIAALVRVGDDPRDEKIICGPLINEAAADRVSTWTAAAKKRGARALVEGERRSPRLRTPGLYTDVPDDEPLWCEEVFGPAAAVEIVPDFATALRRVNKSRYGLQAAVYTALAAHAEAAYRELEVGALLINAPTYTRIDALPYGGVKDSGFGREGPREAIRAYSEPRLLLAKT